VSGGEFLAGFFGVVRGVQMVAMRQLRVMRCLFMRGAAVVFGRLAMMLGGGFVVLGGLVVMVGQLACVHDPLLLYGGQWARGRDMTQGR
jgi:hypothetical protein